MTLKGWMLRKVNGTGAPGHSPRGSAVDDGREPTVGNPPEARPRGSEPAAYLGPYGPLVTAIREELERFVENHLRLHLAIAERDRFVLTSIEVDCEGSDEHRDLLRRFVTEFKPEQVKRYLARDVIAGLRNASAIDLSQFAGLDGAEAPDDEGDDDGYAELIAALSTGTTPADTRAYHVTLKGRWTQSDLPAAGLLRPAGTARVPAPDSHTPLAGRTLALDVEDRSGSRRVEIASVVPGRRYVIGKDAHCDIVVDGVYASRRHCELWCDASGWWVADIGSTNGIRVETERGRRTAGAAPADRTQPLPLPTGASLVLSAQAEGEAAQYPRLALRDPAPEAQGRTIGAAEPATPSTPIAPSKRRKPTLTIAAHMASGVRHADLAETTLPFRIGRSRNQEMVIDWSHAEVSGRHVDIVSVDDDGAWVLVHGDNGVTIEGRVHETGSRVRWKLGETLLLGGDPRTPSGCSLTLARPE